MKSILILLVSCCRVQPSLILCGGELIIMRMNVSMELLRDSATSRRGCLAGTRGTDYNCSLAFGTDAKLEEKVGSKRAFRTIRHCYSPAACSIGLFGYPIRMSMQIGI
ncbi:hypothetical protein BT63DRAFT_248216 [Microthyrium microscopicum]|uniref:Secreted protein n=1 Tax=Microthyrium microscopicum TaxID=703497 RepID=A0A6A6UBM2_9PEZI|nr:hypothetical protein BT63DRAFT_248216 [Microthyrium microscopicum]